MKTRYSICLKMASKISCRKNSALTHKKVTMRQWHDIRCPIINVTMTINGDIDYESGFSP